MAYISEEHDLFIKTDMTGWGKATKSSTINKGLQATGESWEMQTSPGKSIPTGGLVPESPEIINLEYVCMYKCIGALSN